jgi:hypothetical protein
MSYAGKIEDGLVVEFIVGTAEWATNNLGGEWHDSQTKVGAGWTWDDDHGFRPAQPYPSWIWDGITWQPPVPAPDGFYYWDEAQLMWVETDDPFVGPD